MVSVSCFGVRVSVMFHFIKRLCYQDYVSVYVSVMFHFINVYVIRTKSHKVL